MENKADKVLEIKDLEVQYKTKQECVYAINGIDLEIGKGETLGLVGETGAGKTTTALTIMSLLPVPPARITKGSVKLLGEDILKKSDKEMEALRGNKMAMIFQDPMTSLNPVMTVEEQIMEVFIRHEGISKGEAKEKAHAMLEMVGVSPSRGNDYPHQFSGGMKQRVVIAIALASKPELLIADEPTTALDVTIQAQILDKINQLKKETNTSMLMITHDLGIIAETCDKVSIMYAGKIVEHGTLEDIFDHCMHPYTKGLFDSLPRGNRYEAPLHPIGGELPNPAELPSGCAFWPRCKHATEECKKRAPKNTLVGGTEHFVQCLMYENGGNNE